jgi:hypothetical protein
MIFNKGEDIISDIRTKISSYIKQNNDCDDIKNLISIMNSYLYEMKIIKEIESFSVNGINNSKFEVIFSKDDLAYKFYISMDLELRNLKINKITSNKTL